MSSKSGAVVGKNWRRLCVEEDEEDDDFEKSSSKT